MTHWFELVALAFAVYGICDARRARSAREKGVIAAHAIRAWAISALALIKPSVADNQGLVDAINHTMDGIRQEGAKLDAL